MTGELDWNISEVFGVAKTIITEQTRPRIDTPGTIAKKSNLIFGSNSVLPLDIIITISYKRTSLLTLENPLRILHVCM